MEIIKAGDPDKKINKKLKLTCKNCSCEFYFNSKEVMHGIGMNLIGDGSMFVICPWCGCNVDAEIMRRFDYVR